MSRRAWIFLFFFTASPIFADSAGSTGASFLKLGVGARGMAMGEAYTAEAGSVEALYWNPAGLVNAWRPALMFSYKPIVEDTAQSQAAFSMKYKGMAYGIGYNGVSYQSIPAYDDGGNREGDYEASDQMGVVGAAVGSDRLSAGVALKYIRSSIDADSAEAFAGDAGLLFVNPLSPSLTHALVVKNLGGDISFFEQKDPLPLSAVLGNALKFGGRVTGTLDMVWRKAENIGGAAGAEWMVAGDRFKGFALRGGYTTLRNEIDGLSGVSMGAGFGFGTVTLDYAWIPYGELGTTHTVSFLWNLPNIDLNWPPFKGPKRPTKKK